MSTEVAVIVLAIFSALSLRRGLGYRRGSNRDFLGLYRNPARPRIYRNLPLILPYTAGGALMLIAVGSARHLLGSPGPVFDVVLAILAVVSLFALPAISILLAVWSPGWLTPAWLKEDDALVGYVPPNPGWTDRAWLLVAMAASGIGIYFLIVVIPLIAARVAELQRST